MIGHRVQHNDGTCGTIINAFRNGLYFIKRDDGKIGKHYLIDSGGYTNLID